MDKLVNEAVIPVINANQADSQRIQALISIKELVDRLASVSYLEVEEIKRLEKEYGTKPGICTWGDYFQAELATNFLGSSDDEFFRAIDTVRFDIIASVIIFSEKDDRFMKWVESRYLEAIIENETNHNSMSDGDKEIYHLKILKDYYTDMGLLDKLTDVDIEWFNSYSEARAV